MVKTFNSSNDCLCLHTHLDTPELQPSALYTQPRREYYIVSGADRGFRAFNAAGIQTLGDSITLSKVDLYDSMRFTWTNDTRGYEIVSADIILLNPAVSTRHSPHLLNASINNPNDIALADFSLLGAGIFVEATFTSPLWGSRQVSPLVSPGIFRDSFGQGWR